MKKLIFITVVALVCNLFPASAAQLRRTPISNWFLDEILRTFDVALSQTPSRGMVLTEGVASDPTSTTQNVYDYFTIYTGKEPNYGAILRLSPFGLNPGTGGITGNEVWFKQLLPEGGSTLIVASVTNIGALPATPQDRIIGPGGYVSNLYHIGSCVVDGTHVSVRVRYHLNLLRPTVDLSWGTGSGPGNPGTVMDDHDRPWLETLAPTTRTHLMTVVSNTIQFAVRAPDEGFILETSRNLTEWSAAPLPTSILGFTYYYDLGTNSPHMFFRTRPIP